MCLVDANVILRLILNDNAQMVAHSKEFIVDNEVLVRNEVLAEVVYVLTKVYGASRQDVANCMLAVITTENITVESQAIISYAVDLYGSSRLDFVDCLLCAYHVIDRQQVFTFDKALQKQLERQSYQPANTAQ